MYSNKKKKYSPITINELLYISQVVKMFNRNIKTKGVPNNSVTTITYATIEMASPMPLTPMEVQGIKKHIKMNKGINIEIERSQASQIRPYYYISKICSV